MGNRQQYAGYINESWRIVCFSGVARYYAMLHTMVEYYLSLRLVTVMGMVSKDTVGYPGKIHAV